MEKKFIALLLKRAIVSKEQLLECQKIQKDMATMGLSYKIWEIWWRRIISLPITAISF